MNEKTKRAIENLIKQADRLERHNFQQHILKVGFGFRGSQKENNEWEIEFDVPDEGELDKTVPAFRLFNQQNEDYSFHKLDKLVENDLGLSNEFKENVIEIRKKYFDYLNGYPESIKENFLEDGAKPSRGEILNVVMYGSGLAHDNHPTRSKTYTHWSRDGIRKNILLQEFTKIVFVILSLIKDLSEISKRELSLG
ncbi:MAG: hypothetical protein U0X93_17755 [Anaerolineales bacterium]